jgi:hypothetical protein
MGRTRIDAYRRRVLAARTNLRALPPIGAGRRGAPDPETGERWDRLNALGHIAEMLPLWTDQVRRSLREGAVIGRDQSLVEARQQAIDRASQAGEAALRTEIEHGIGRLLSLLDELDDPALDREVALVAGSHDRETTVGDVIQARLVGHLETHLHQLAELG